MKLTEPNKPADKVLLYALLDEIQNMRFQLTKDLESGFTMHEIKPTKAEVAILPGNFTADDFYLRAYLTQMEPGDMRLIIDDVIFDADIVDLTHEIRWDSTAGEWVVSEVVPLA